MVFKDLSNHFNDTRRHNTTCLVLDKATRHEMLMAARHRGYAFTRHLSLSDRELRSFAETNDAEALKVVKTFYRNLGTCEGGGGSCGGKAARWGARGRRYGGAAR